MSLEWRNGRAMFTDATGVKHESPAGASGTLDALRYLALGRNASSRSSGLGMRFLRARLVDLDKPAAPYTRPRSRVVFDVDLTKGKAAMPPQALVLGGKWDNGWEPERDQGQRIVFDAGYQIHNGVLEVTVARRATQPPRWKTDVMGLYEEPSLDHSDLHGDTFLLRIGEEEVKAGVQGNIKAFAKERIPEHWGMLWEERFGQASDWTTDGATPHTLRFEWKDGVARFTDVKGNVMICPDGKGGKVDNLRYVALGGDRYDAAASLVGMKFLRMKLLDLDVSERP